jgi:hypothetical protein
VKVKYGKLLLTVFAFNINLRRYTLEDQLLSMSSALAQTATMVRRCSFTGSITCWKRLELSA